MLLFIELQRQVDHLFFVVDLRLRLGREIDESVLPVRFAVILKGLADFSHREKIALMKRENALQRVDLQRQSFVRVRADDFQRTHVVAVAFFNGNGDVDCFPVGPARHRHAHAEPCRVHVLQNRLSDYRLEIAVVLIQSAYADFHVFVQFFAVVRFGQNRDVPKMERNRVGPVVAHRADDLAVAERVVAGELDASHLDLGPFVHFEHEDHRVARCDSLVLRRNFRELPPVLSK